MGLENQMNARPEREVGFELQKVADPEGKGSNGIDGQTRRVPNIVKGL